MAHFFDAICGSDAAATMTKNQIVEKAMNLVGVAPAESLLIGDSANDAESAAQLGIPFIGVTYGYGFKTDADIAKFPHIACAQNPLQLVDFIAR
jgi:phosphoglycolate phosphatase